MNIVHHIFVNPNAKERKELAALGVVLAIGQVAFDLDPSHPRWPEIEEWARRSKVVITTRTEFENEEIRAAKWLSIVPIRHKGYPQPEKSYRTVTYDLSLYCATCGAGRVQKAPFRLKGEPKWDKDGIFQLNWVFDEYFAKPEVWERVFEPLGVGKREVLGTQEETLSTVVQLVIDAYVNVAVKPETGTKCPVCGQIKYAVHTRGMFPHLLNAPIGHLVKTRQYFGAGGVSAWHPVLASQQLVQSLIKYKVSGISFWPVAENSKIDNL